MNATTFQQPLSKLLAEIFDGPPRDWSYVLNPGDPGLLQQLDSIDAETASTPPVRGQTTITAHVNHLCFSFVLQNRWAAGEENPWADADWDGSWRRDSVTSDEWHQLREDFLTRGKIVAKHSQNTYRLEWN